MAQARESKVQLALNLIYVLVTLHPLSTLTSLAFSREIPQFGEERKTNYQRNSNLLQNHYKLLCRAVDTKNTN